MKSQSLLGLLLVALMALPAVAAKKPAAKHRVKARSKANTQHSTARPKPVETGPPLVPPYAPWPRQAKDINWPKLRQFSRAMSGVMRSSALGVPEGWFVETPPVEGVKGILSSIGASGNSQYVHMGITEFLVMQGIGVSGLYGDKTTSVVFYDLVGDWLFNPQISQDGRKMIIYSGSPTGGNDGFGLLFWNFLNGESISGGYGMNNGRQSVSPDGLQFAGITVHDTENYTMQDVQKPWDNNEPGLLVVYDTNHFLINGSQPMSPDEEPGKRFITNLAATRTVVWTSDNRLLYTHAPAADQPKTRISPITDAPNRYPSVWIADPRTKATHQLIERAYDPSPSPDGKYITFFGWNTDEKPTPQQPASEPKLWIYQVATKKRFEINAQNAGYLGWTPDSKTLVTGRFEGPFKLHIGSLALTDALQGPQHIVDLRMEKATLETQDAGVSLWPRDPLEVRSIARNGRYVIVNTTHPSHINGESFRRDQTLQAVDLSDGHISIIARADPPDAQWFSWSWFDESDAPAAK